MFQSPHINDFPPEVLLHIMRQLPHDDVCNAYQVCTKWRPIAEDESLWKNYDLKMHRLKEEDLKKFSTHPYKKVKSILADTWNPSKELAVKLFDTIVTKKIEMEELSIFNSRGSIYRRDGSWVHADSAADFTDVSVENLVKVATNVKELCFDDIKLSGFQLNTLFRALHQGPSSLTSLSLCGSVLTCISDNYLANISRSLSCLDFGGWRTQLTDSQLDSLFYSLEQGPSKLQTLDLAHIDLTSTSINFTSLANASRSLYCLILEYSKVSSSQMKILLSTLATGDNVLIKSLNLNWLEGGGLEDLSIVDADHIATLAERLTDLQLDLDHMSDSTFAHFISALAKKSLSNLDDLYLNHCDFSLVNIKDLSEVLSNLKRLGMIDSAINRTQFANLFTYLAKKVVANQCNLADVEFCELDFSRVAADDFIRVITNLESVNLSNTKLSSKRYKKVFKAIVNGTDVKLKEISVGRSDVKDVPEDLIDAVKTKINVIIDHRYD